jgi:hypothetical protein
MPDQPLTDINHFIDLKIAIEMTSRYRQHMNTILRPDYQGRDILPIAEAFNKKALQDLLNQADCIGLRFYYGMSADYQLHLIICGVDGKEEDITDASALIADDSKRCPPRCSLYSPLNT